MSLTPGWIEKSEDHTVGMQALTCDFVRLDGNHYYLDNGSEYKEYPRIKEGWTNLCEDLKGFEF